MPTRLQQSKSRTATAAVEDPEPEAHSGPYNVPQLDFNEPLTWRAGRAIPVADLFDRLKRLFKELCAAEQGSIEVADITKLAQDLVHSNLLGHKDKGIRAWTVCCVVDILNLCAPNAPYRNDQLRDIFVVIVNSILPALADPSNTYNAQHQYILKQLVDAESILLITDLQDSEPLLTSLFTICFDLVSGSGKNSSGNEIGETVEYRISALLTFVAEEATLPPDVVDIIILQFLRVDPRSLPQPPTGKKRLAEAKDKTQSTLLLKSYPAAYNMAKVICTSCSTKISGAIGQYYSNIVNNASTALSTDDAKGKVFKRPQSPGSDSDEDDAQALNDLQKVHRLIKELWRACPDVLLGVIPQCEIELAADSVALRELAVDTLGDLIAGIGLAGLPDLPVLDPAAYPLPTIEATDDRPLSTNPLLNPSSPKPFMQVHASAYQAFLRRRIDKAQSVRIAWVKAVSKILLTGAGGIGMNDEERADLIAGLASMLKDVDEKVRLATLQSLKSFSYRAVIHTLGSDGGLAKPESLLSAIAERVVDKKLPVREQAMLLLGTMWGVASRDIGEGNELVRSIVGQAPTHILSAMYVKDPHVTMMLLKVLYECLLPLTYPPIKVKVASTTVSSQGESTNPAEDPDSIRVRRILTLVRDLGDKSKPIFFGLQKRQADVAKGITTFLKCCEDYNGGVAEDVTEEKQLEEKLNKIIDILARQQPESSKFSNDLQKFAKAHDRRNYQLIRFAMGPEHDFKTMAKAIKEFNKRVRESSNTEATLESLNSLIYQCTLVCYNRSHLPAIIEYSRTPDATFSEAAQELLREISEKVPAVMKSHIQVLCTELVSAAPTHNQAESLPSIDALKACAAFSRKFPEEVPKDRKFEVALMHYIEFSVSPKAAKHATTILLKTSNKRELRAKEIITKAVKKIVAGAKNKLAQLAAISQVCLLAPAAASVEEDRILQIVADTLHTNPAAEEAEEENLAAWSDDADEETAVKKLILQILVNRCRSGKESDRENFDLLANQVIGVLMKIISSNGETTPTNNTSNIQKNHLRLAAGCSIIKLARHKARCEDLITPLMFETICQIMINPPYAVRRGILSQIKKYLNTNSLTTRWYTIFFLTAFEVDSEIKISTFAWLKSRAAIYVRQQQGRNADKKHAINTMELTFARLLSLLTHHPDYPVKGTEMYNGELLDFAKYIIYYLQTIATDDNLSLIFHIAQRVKQTQDALSDDPEVQERLYVLSDLAQATIRNYADLMPAHARGMNLLQTWPGKAHLPNALFGPINGHVKAQEIAAKNYLPEDVALGLETLVKQVVRNTKAREPKVKHRTPAGDRKRRISVSIDPDDNEADKNTKKRRTRTSTSLPIRKTPATKKRKSEALSVEQPSRKSARTSNVRNVNYMESDEEDEDDGDAENIVKYNPASAAKKSEKKVMVETPELEEEDENEDDEGQEVEEGGSPTPLAKRSTNVQDNEVDANDEKDDGQDEPDGDHDEEMEEIESDAVNPEPPQDAEMTDEDDAEEDTAEVEADTDQVDDQAEQEEEDQEMTTDENPADQEQDQESSDPEVEAEESTTPPKSNGTKRATRARGKPTPTPPVKPKTKIQIKRKSTVKVKDSAKSKTPAKSTSKATKESTSKTVSKPVASTRSKKVVVEMAVPASSSPPPPPAAEPSRRSSRRGKM